MKPKGSLPHLQGPATCPYPQPVQSSPCSPSHFLKTYFNIIFPTPRSSKATSFPQVSPPKPCMHLSCLLYVPLRITIISSSLTYKIDTDVSQYFFFCKYRESLAIRTSNKILMRQTKLIWLDSSLQPAASPFLQTGTASDSFHC